MLGRFSLGKLAHATLCLEGLGRVRPKKAAINPDDPVDPLWNGGGDGLQNTGNLGDFRTALGRQICTAWRKQHLRGKDETVAFNSDPFLIAKTGSNSNCRQASINGMS